MRPWAREVCGTVRFMLSGCRGLVVLLGDPWPLRCQGSDPQDSLPAAPPVPGQARPRGPPGRHSLTEGGAGPPSGAGPPGPSQPPGLRDLAPAGAVSLGGGHLGLGGTSHHALRDPMILNAVGRMAGSRSPDVYSEPLLCGHLVLGGAGDRAAETILTLPSWDSQSSGGDGSVCRQ